jgi:hypothetical protein
MCDKKSQKINEIFYCEICNYYANRNSDLKKHCQTIKHKNRERLQNTTQNSQEIKKTYKCECGKQYLHHSSLYKHKKICKLIPSIHILETKLINNESDDMKNLVYKLIDENKELRKTITDIIPQIGSNNINNTVKQKFNINVFLNEKCKDALSMDEFINKIEISMKNLLNTKEKGHIEGISDIIIENMNKLSLYERPLHCTDKKRETLYVKNDEWEKDSNKECINKALKQIECKQIKNIQIWLDEHPNYMNNPNEQDEFIKLISETSKSVIDNSDKIVKNICNNTFIDDI